MDVCGLISWICIVYVTFGLLHSLFNIVYPFFLAKPRDLHKLAGGKWAVVTGATDGIGKGYAFELARSGFSILLISRTQSRLDEVKNEIEQKTGVQVRTIVFDFSNPDLENYELNNVGCAFEYPDLYHKVDGGIALFRHISIINIIPVTLVGFICLPLVAIMLASVLFRSSKN
ncbi:unnamed protein product [Gongylonema pulchrum]|uniref:Estradiol 17-beta-dehydrogenase 12 n=1 Tax=Gongylonema pulchrum TaxID=637853 RepID=A0A183EFQ1_9BILA|nr:unnamed protein product [Gongylonema pulchrum]